jgi:MFS family permease
MSSKRWRVAGTPSVAWFLVGSAVSNLGTYIYNLASAVLMYRLTDSAFLVGAVVFSQFIGTLVLAPLAGGMADRFDRRRLLMLLQSLGAVPMALLAVAEFLGKNNPTLLLVATLMVGLASALSSPARQALVPQLAPSEEVESLIAFHVTTFQVARAVGPLVGAVVIALWGMPTAIGINAVSFLIFVFALSRIHSAVHEKAKRVVGSFRGTLVTAWQDPSMRTFLLSIVAMSFATDPPATLAPTYVAMLGHSDAAAGLIMGAFGFGSLVVAAFFATNLARSRYGFVGSMAGQFLGVVLFAVSPNLVTALIALAIAGGGYVGALTRATGEIQRFAPEGSMGRYMAIWGVALLGSRPLAALIDGAAAEMFGARLAALVVVLPLAAFVLLPTWRKRLLADRVPTGSTPDS